MNRHKIFKARRTWLIVAGTIFVAVIATWLMRSPDMSKPEVAVPIKTHELYISTLFLQASFSSTESSKEITEKYLLTLDQMQKDCQDIHDYNKIALEKGRTPEFTERLTNTMALCDDLARLIIDSKLVYRPIYPLLNTDTTLKRYEKIPYLYHLTHESIIRHTDTAIQELEEDVRTIVYPTQVLTHLKQLRSDLSKSSDLSYAPLLKTFQTQVLAERQQYWTTNGNIAGLSKTLIRQLQGYCQELEKDDIKLNICNNFKEV